MVGAIRASATPDRADRLFPGDIDQFRFPGGGLGLAHGAAGVLYALSEAAGVRVPEYEEWLVTRAAEPPKGMRLGLYDGLAGAAYTLGPARPSGRRGTGGAQLPRRELGPARPRPLRRPVRVRARHDLRGRPCRRATAGRRRDTGRADRRGTVCGRRARRGRPRAAAGSRGAVGLLHGASGKALLFIRLYERTGDPAYLDAAEGAIAVDLERCVTDGNGALQVDDGWRTLPYLAGGSVGIGMVIDQFTAHRRNEAFADAARAIRLAASSGFYAQAGLFNGRAGMIAYLSGTRDESEQDAAGRVAAPRSTGWPGTPSGTRAAWRSPGDMLLRLSMDLGTGTAGVLLGTAAALAPGGAALPFFARPSKPPCSGSRVPPGARPGGLQPASLARR